MATRLGKTMFAVPQVQEGGIYPQSLEKGQRSERTLKRAFAEEEAADLRAVFNASDRAEAERPLRQAVRNDETTVPKLSAWMDANAPEGLTVFSFSDAHRRKLRTNNGIERAVNLEIVRRTRVMRVLTNACDAGPYQRG